MLFDFVSLTSLVILTSSESSGRRLRPLDNFGFAKIRVTFAFLAGRLDLPPLKIRSFEFWARSTFAERAPNTN